MTKKTHSMREYVEINMIKHQWQNNQGLLPPKPPPPPPSAVVDLRGRRGRVPPSRQNFSHAVFGRNLGKIGQIVGWRPPLGCRTPFWEILDPPLIWQILSHLAL